MTEAAAAQPQDFDGLRSMIIAQRDDLPKRIAQIAAYALDHPDEIAFGTVASIAVAADVQPSTLIRFSQYFGFDGFSSLQDVFRRRLRARTSSYDERLSRLRHDTPGQGAQATLAGLLSASHQSLDRIAGTLDEPLVERVDRILFRHRGRVDVDLDRVAARDRGACTHGHVLAALAAANG